MAAKTVPIGEFRQRATAYIKSVEETKEPLTITRRGVAVAELRPAPTDPSTLRGSVAYSSEVDLTEPVIDPGEWEADG